MTRLTGLLAAALAALAVLATSAGAAVWTAPLSRCYVSVGPDLHDRQIVPVGADGFPALAPVDVLLDGQATDATDDGQPDPFYADPSGKVTASVRAPYQASGERPFTLSVTEHANSGNSVSVTSKVTALAVGLYPAQAPPSRRVLFAGRGFTKRAAVWGHYLYRGKVRRTVRLARRPEGDCGTFSVHRRQIPVVRPRIGKWTLQVDQQRTYASSPDTVFVRITITVGRRIRTSSAGGR
jgi:hypothetical protein